jgi:hypothetical protein
MQNVNMLSVVMLNAFMVSVVMLNVIVLSFVMLNVVGPDIFHFNLSAVFKIYISVHQNKNFSVN